MHNCNDHFMFFCCCFSFFFSTTVFLFIEMNKILLARYFILLKFEFNIYMKKRWQLFKKNVLVLVKDPDCNVQQFLLAFIERKMKVILEKQEFYRNVPWDIYPYIWQIRRFKDHYRLCHLFRKKMMQNVFFWKLFRIWNFSHVWFG